jgi:hypothetical protein
MSDETGFSAIEERLQAEAKQMLPIEAPRAGAQLWAVYQRRRAAPMRLAAAAAVLSAILLGAMLGWRQSARTLRLERQVQAAVASLKREKPLSPRPPIAVAPVPRNSQALYPKETGESRFVVPFVIDDPATGEEIMSGFYVPERVEPLDLRQLPPAERDAIRAVLGISGDLVDGEVI